MCGLWSLNDLYVNQSYLIGTIAAKRKVLSVSAPHFTQSDGGGPFKMTCTRSCTELVTNRKPGWLTSSPVSFLCTWSNRNACHMRASGKTNTKPATGLILTANGTKLQHSLGRWSAQSQHRASDREARLGQEGLRLCKALRVFCLQFSLYCCVNLSAFFYFSGLQSLL